jgi:hypothetical protein
VTEDFDIDKLLFGVKRCAHCGAEKAANTEQFVRDKSQADGLTRTCKACRAARGRAAYLRDPAKYAEKARLYYQRKKAAT